MEPLIYVFLEMHYNFCRILFYHRILEMMLKTMKQDDHIKDLEQAKTTLTRNQFNAYHIRQGQRKIIKIFQNWLT